MGAHYFYGGMYIKKPKTYRQQIEILKSKNLIITDEQKAELFLQRVNYYRISGYFLPFLKDHQKFFISDISIDKIQAIYEFDKELRNILAGVVDEIEIYLRSQLAYFHAQKYGEEGYMDSSNYNKNHDHNVFMKRVNLCIKENNKTAVVQHHQNKYGGHFPIWVIIEFFSFGTLSYFYRGMNNQDKSYLANHLYGVNYQTLDSWMRCLNDLRNRCAHYSRLYYWIFPAIPKMPPKEKYVPTRRLFAQIYMIKMMYPDQIKWNDQILKSLIRLINKYRPYISPKHLDFPYRWKSLLHNH